MVHGPKGESLSFYLIHLQHPTACLSLGEVWANQFLEPFCRMLMAVFGNQGLLEKAKCLLAQYYRSVNPGHKPLFAISLAQWSLWLRMSHIALAFRK